MLIRIRSIDSNVRFVLKKSSMPSEVQNIFVVLLKLLFVMHFVAGLLRSAANFALGSTENWVVNDGLYDETIWT